MAQDVNIVLSIPGHRNQSFHSSIQTIVCSQTSLYWDKCCFKNNLSPKTSLKSPIPLHASTGSRMHTLNQRSSRYEWTVTQRKRSCSTLCLTTSFPQTSEPKEGWSYSLCDQQASMLEQQFAQTVMTDSGWRSFLAITGKYPPLIPCTCIVNLYTWYKTQETQGNDGMMRQDLVFIGIVLYKRAL